MLPSLLLTSNIVNWDVNWDECNIYIYTYVYVSIIDTHTKTFNNILILIRFLRTEYVYAYSISKN